MSLMTCIPYKYWARSHNHHHAHQGQLDTRTIGDVTLLTVREYNELSNWGKIKYRIYRSVPVMFVLDQFTTFLFANRIPFIKFKGWEKERLTLLRTNLYLLRLFAILGVILSLPTFDLIEGFKKLALLYIPILITFILQRFGFFTCNISTTQITKHGKKIGNIF